MEEVRKYPVADFVASGAMVLVLLAVTFWGFGVTSVARRIPMMYAEMDAAELPAISRFLLHPVVTFLLLGLHLVTLLGGIAVLILVRDRVRALVYAMVIILVSVAGVMLLQFAAMLPLIKVIQMVGQ